MNTNTHHHSLSDGIALLGATGRSGSAILRLCLERGIAVSALYRSGTVGMVSPSLRIVQGDARDPLALSALFEGRSAIVSALGRRRGEPPLFAETARALIEAARKNGVKRYLGLTGGSLALPGDRFTVGHWLQSALLSALFRDTLVDRDESVRIIMGSELEWTLPRLPLILPELPASGYRADPRKPNGTRISPTDIAAAVLDMLADGQYVGQAPFLSSKE